MNSLTGVETLMYEKLGFDQPRVYCGSLILERPHQIANDKNPAWTGQQSIVISDSMDFPGGFIVEASHTDNDKNRIEETASLANNDEGEFEFESGLVRLEGEFTLAEAVESGLAMLQFQENELAVYTNLGLAVQAQAQINKLHEAGFYCCISPGDLDMGFDRPVPGFEGQELLQSISIVKYEPALYSVEVRYNCSRDSQDEKDALDLIFDGEDYREFTCVYSDLAEALTVGLAAAERLMKDVSSMLKETGITASTQTPVHHLFGIVDDKEQVFYYDTPDDRIVGFTGLVLQDSRDGVEQSYAFFVADSEKNLIEDESVRGPTSHYARIASLDDIAAKGWTAVTSGNRKRGEHVFKTPCGARVGLVIHTGNDSYSAILAVPGGSGGQENLTVGQAFKHLEQSYAAVRAQPVIGKEGLAVKAPGKDKKRNETER